MSMKGFGYRGGGRKGLGGRTTSKSKPQPPKPKKVKLGGFRSFGFR